MPQAVEEQARQSNLSRMPGSQQAASLTASPASPSSPRSPMVTSTRPAAANPPNGVPNIIAFFNSKSGGRKGLKVKRALERHLGADRVLNLSDSADGLWKPEEKLEQWKGEEDLKLLVCGGDGTMGWLFSCIDRVQDHPGQFPMAMMPLGTGNDLARTFRWGPGFSGRMLKKRFIDKVGSAVPVPLDRWLISILPQMPLGEKEAKEHLPPTFSVSRHCPGVNAVTSVVTHRGQTFSRDLSRRASGLYTLDSPSMSKLQGEFDESSVHSSQLDPCDEEEEVVASPAPVRVSPPMSPSRGVESYDSVFCNYYSVGLDAVAALAFHEHRTRYPEKFKSQLRNQMYYIQKGFPAAGGFFHTPPPKLYNILTLQIRRTVESELETIDLPRDLRGVIILNLQSYGGGRDLWGSAGEDNQSCLPWRKTRFSTPRVDDGLLEVVGVSTIYKMGCIMGLNKMGVHAQQLAQGVEIKMKVSTSISMQIDGEPWNQAAGEVTITHFGRSTCLIPRKHYKPKKHGPALV